MEDYNLNMKLQEINNLINQSRYDEAFEECSVLMRDPSSEKDEILRVRARGFARSGDHLNAVRDYENIVEGGSGNISDFYLAAYNALYIKDYEKSEAWFIKVLLDGENNNETWFQSAVLFYLAYLRMESGHFDEAVQFLDKSDNTRSDNGLPLPGVGMCDRAQLLAEIERRRSL